jgi:hypothetical protein
LRPERINAALVDFPEGINASSISRMRISRISR